MLDDLADVSGARSWSAIGERDLGDMKEGASEPVFVSKEFVDPALAVKSIAEHLVADAVQVTFDLYSNQNTQTKHTHAHTRKFSSEWQIG